MRDDEVILVGVALRTFGSDLDPSTWNLQAAGRTVPLKTRGGPDGVAFGEAEVHRDLAGDLVAIAHVPLRETPRLVGHPYLAVLVEVTELVTGDDDEPASPRLVSVHVTTTASSRRQPPYEVHTSPTLNVKNLGWLTRDYTSMTVVKNAFTADPAHGASYVEWRHRAVTEPR